MGGIECDGCQKGVNSVSLDHSPEAALAKGFCSIMGVTKSLCMCWRRKLSGRAVQSEKGVNSVSLDHSPEAALAKGFCSIMGVTKSLCMCWRRKLSGRAVQSENAGDESEKLWQTVDSLYSIPAWTGNQWRACWRGYIDHICMYWKPISLHSSECTSVLPLSTQLRNSTSNLVDSKIRVPLHPYHNANEGAKKKSKKMALCRIHKQPIGYNHYEMPLASNYDLSGVFLFLK